MSDSAFRTPHSALDAPIVTCLCPTYGRFHKLRDSLACWLLQDYPHRRLIILNDAPVPIRLGRDVPGVSVVNAHGRFPNLGAKRQALLRLAASEVVMHWDDDDLMLPWHVSECVRALTESGAGMASPDSAWWAPGPDEALDVKRIAHNTFDGLLTFRRREALDLGGYPPLDSGQAKALMQAFKAAGRLHRYRPAPADVSYVYRWAEGSDHVSARGARPSRDGDFGEGFVLLPPGPGEWGPLGTLVDWPHMARQAAQHLYPLMGQVYEGMARTEGYGVADRLQPLADVTGLRQDVYTPVSPRAAALWELGVCYVCGCSDEDCSGSIERTGGPCHWAAPGLCSACAGSLASHGKGPSAGLASPVHAPPKSP